MNNSKVAIAVSKAVSLIQMTVGIILVFLFALCSIMYLIDKEYAAYTGIGFLIICLIITGIGVWLIILSRKKSKLAKEFKKYVAVISQDPSCYIPDIAVTLGTSEDVVKNNIEQMIKKKFFSNAYIDRDSNYIVIASKQVVQKATTPVSNFANAQAVPIYNAVQAVPTYNAAPTVEMVTVKCNGCGGINTIAKGQTGECDFCGSAIKGA